MILCPLNYSQSKEEKIQIIVLYGGRYTTEETYGMLWDYRGAWSNCGGQYRENFNRGAKLL